MNTGADYFSAKLQSQIDVVDAADALKDGGLFLVDSRRRASWNHGHIYSAIHLLTRKSLSGQQT